VSAAELARALGGRQVGHVWMACCPAHDDKTPSLSIQEGVDSTLLVHCFAGCGQALVIAALGDRGLWPNGDRHHNKKNRQHVQRSTPDSADRDNRARRRGALRIWDEADPGAGTIVATYLRGRGISLDTLPAGIRFHPECWRPRDDAGNPVPPLPAMVALVEHIEQGPVAIHATYLRPDGTGKADIPKREQKACLGPIASGAVRLGTPRRNQWLGVAEGIETALSVAVACAIPVWAALSAAGIKSLVLPADATHVVICADHDESGTGERVARDAADRWLAEGRRVRIAIPPLAGTDFNDVLTTYTMGTRQVA
jgi:putative DNA primase/helicase